jgi:hypothetical protein
MDDLCLHAFGERKKIVVGGQLVRRFHSSETSIALGRVAKDLTSFGGAIVSMTVRLGRDCSPVFAGDGSSYATRGAAVRIDSDVLSCPRCGPGQARAGPGQDEDAPRARNRSRVRWLTT